MTKLTRQQLAAFNRLIDAYIDTYGCSRLVALCRISSDAAQWEDEINARLSLDQVTSERPSR